MFDKTSWDMSELCFLIKRYLDTKQVILLLLSVRTGKTGGRKKMTW